VDLLFSLIRRKIVVKLRELLLNGNVTNGTSWRRNEKKNVANWKFAMVMSERNEMHEIVQSEVTLNEVVLQLRLQALIQFISCHSFQIQVCCHNKINC
jgi:hypothetical protein